jgi:hypothetical protein
MGFEPGWETIRSASSIVIPGKVVLNRKSDSSLRRKSEGKRRVDLQARGAGRRT